MKKIYFSLLIFFSGVTLTVSGQNNPEASDSAILRPGKEVRFTVLTPRIVRMEWDSAGTFSDNASFVVINRRLPVPAYSSKVKGGWLEIKTKYLTVKYRMGSGKFSSLNLSIAYKGDNKESFIWKPGLKQQANLKGTARTLDGYDGDTYRDGKKIELEDGLLSKDGWFFMDDSKSFLFDKSDWPWVTQRSSGESQDWYFMGYGKDYKSVLLDFTKIAGKVPLPPRYAFGYWWSRYWAYSDNELRDLYNNFQKFNVPLDVMVVDMDWHKTDSIRAKPDAFGQRKWWTGWTWNRGLFPDPMKFLQWTDSQHLKTTLNLHPASGIAPFEEQYGAFAKKMNFDTTARKNIPYIGSDKRFMQNLFDIVLHPMERQGIDFWWLDWQQWPEDKKVAGLSNTWWLNYVFFTEMERSRETRPMLYHRWGGLGNHRYQIGFSGDAIISWKSLEYQPYFTNTASNVLYGYWSHDIGGHMFRGGKGELDPELYTRWVQYGAFSPVFRTHSSKNATLNKEIWNFRGDYFNAQYNAIKLRYALAPYIYTMARKTWESGISLCRPMYYDYPDMKEAYDFNREYQFGDDMIIAPIGTPSINGFSKVKVWLPAGSDWYEWNTGTLLKGGQVLEREFSIDEYPVYVRAGAVVPMYFNDVQNLDENPGKISLAVFPGASGSGRMYEDNGNDKFYEKEYAYTSFKTRVLPDKSMEIVILPREGFYRGMKDERSYQVTLFGSTMPREVTVNGNRLDYSVGDQGKESWGYRGKDLSVNINLSSHRCSETISIKLKYDQKEQVTVNDGLKEKFKRLSRATTDLKFKESKLVLPALIGQTEETNLMLEYSPEKFNELIRNFNVNYKLIPESLKGLQLGKETEQQYLLQLGLQ